MPIALMNNSGAGLLRLMSKGVSVIYVGLDFSKSIGPNGLLFVTPPETLITLNRSSLAQYAIREEFPKGQPANMSFSKQTYVFGSEQRYGNVTYTGSINGAVVAFSNYPKSSWKSVQSMASDLASAIDARFWMLSIGYRSGPVNVVGKPSGAIGAFAQTPDKYNMTLLGVDINQSFSLIRKLATNSNSSARIELSVKNDFKEKGSLATFELPNSVMS